MQSVMFRLFISPEISRKMKQYARRDHGDNQSLLVRMALAEYFARHYGDQVDPHMPRGGYREASAEG